MTINETDNSSGGSNPQTKEELYNQDFHNHFLEETRNILNNSLSQTDPAISGKWIELMTERAMETFCSGQLISSRKESMAELQDLYRSLWKEIAERMESGNIDLEFVRKMHMNRLSGWLFETGSIMQGIHDPQSIRIREFARLGLPVDFQMDLLQMDPDKMPEPVLELGCGKEASLVHYLREKGKQAFGIDHQITETPYLFHIDWMNFEFQPHTWGTIISNLSFALHFTEHYQQKDGQYILYARKYMEILNSLKNNGSFCYTPGLPFIEAYLPKDKFRAEHHRINGEFFCTRITAL